MAGAGGIGWVWWLTGRDWRCQWRKRIVTLDTLHPQSSGLQLDGGYGPRCVLISS
jgi:hypothetical protein